MSTTIAWPLTTFTTTISTVIALHFILCVPSLLRYRRAQLLQAVIPDSPNTLRRLYSFVIIIVIRRWAGKDDRYFFPRTK